MRFSKIKIIIFLLILSYLLPCRLNAYATQDFNLTSQAVLLVEMSTGEIFYSRNESGRLPPASTTKIMTVLLAIEAYESGKVSLGDMVTATEDSHFDLTYDSSTAGILPGEIMSFENLLYCALVSSANEACNILAEHVAGSVSDFIILMNERAKELGCTATKFANTHGLPNDNHYTSAYDLYLISAEAMNHPLFMRIANTVKREIPATNMSDIRRLTTTNNLIDPDSTAYYRYASGMKTGSTESAGFCLVSSAEMDGITLLCVVLGAKALPLEDGAYEIMSFTESKMLYEWFYSNYSYREALSRSELICQVSVEMGEGMDSVIVRPAEAIKLIMPNNVDPDTAFIRNITIFSETDGAEPLCAPITKGQALGEITVTYNGKLYGPIPLIANTDVNLSKVEYMKTRISETIKQPWIFWTIIILLLIFFAYAAFVIRYNLIRHQMRKMKKAAASPPPESLHTNEFDNNT